MSCVNVHVRLSESESENEKQVMRIDSKHDVESSDVSDYYDDFCPVREKVRKTALLHSVRSESHASVMGLETACN